ncbi:MAG: hypothetical protein A2Z58_09195 [Planctomycetes bacterium RIFCSPHIGHO2_12_42_15]|nr:MAG: hypothetical protein A2Z58_09195 [Planctomycetes bacterium RIFCSPHIGHO2_12_42_15]
MKFSFRKTSLKYFLCFLSLIFILIGVANISIANQKRNDSNKIILIKCADNYDEGKHNNEDDYEEKEYEDGEDAEESDIA